ncbi:hypothetical protein BTZ20_4931 [Rhodococcus sp. MTM3W5.2]|nr:hypothetical protein BTZ20_4931 [Rhodococcus sp. MTM3W5.2]
MSTYGTTSGAERAIIETMLDRNREALIETARGLSEADARRRLVASLTTPISLIKHAAAAERIWFQRFWAGLDESECDGYSRRDEGTFAVADDESLADVIAEFERASQRSREIASRFDLDDTKDNPAREASACGGRCSPSSKSSPGTQATATSSANSSKRGHSVSRTRRASALPEHLPQLADRLMPFVGDRSRSPGGSRTIANYRGRIRVK